MLRIAIAILLLIFTDCRGKPKQQETEPALPAQTQLPDAPPPAQPPADVKNPVAVNPRIASSVFLFDEKIVQAVRLPASDKPPLFILHGRFSGKKPLYAYVFSDRIRFVQPNGTVEAEIPSGFALSPRLVLRVPGAAGKPDRVLTAWGRDMMRRKDTANSVVFTLAHLSGKTAVQETLHQATTQRPDPQNAAVAPDGSIMLAWFSDKYTVQAAIVSPGGKTVKTLLSAPMISRLAFLKTKSGNYTLAVARVYGDQPGSDGGLFLFENEKWRQLPTVRGVRGLCADIRPDGWDLWVGDCWDKDYGRVAKACISLVSVRGTEAQRRQIAEIPGSFSVFDILPCNLLGPKKPGKLIQTNNQLLWISADGKEGPQYLASWSSPSPPVVADIDGDGFDEVLIATPEPLAIKAKK